MISSSGTYRYANGTQIFAYRGIQHTVYRCLKLIRDVDIQRRYARYALFFKCPKETRIRIRIIIILR